MHNAHHYLFKKSITKQTHSIMELSFNTFINDERLNNDCSLLSLSIIHLYECGIVATVSCFKGI